MEARRIEKSKWLLEICSKDLDLYIPLVNDSCSRSENKGSSPSFWLAHQKMTQTKLYREKIVVLVLSGNLNGSIQRTVGCKDLKFWRQICKKL